ncbi:hypothetical protein SAMN05660649_01023 [Desulfotomaculum arcticum]|uniref:Uncharacterized protein n=1 Tax=Desulfotruncus arcticus DSM 17038 TaxID=1121424 RepID=A0A1I2Q3A7_9FIRM|nr:hypothetical protein [Desulfotruncus arcticus]SFG22390.1 hypothetical protein SAMN05660649_01023 [Desulfotomaculum arcticum] [Desulfotruncus arcticus DSM 17038]
MAIKLLKIIALVIILNISPLICLALVTSHYNELTIEVTYPYDGNRILKSPMPVYGFVSNSLAKVDINGTPVVVAENGYFHGSVDLVEGVNKIIVTAENQKKDNAIKVISINFLPKR